MPQKRVSPRPMNPDDPLADPYARWALRVAYHVRNYVALYVIGVVLILIVAFLPSANRVDTAGIGSGLAGGEDFGAGVGEVGGLDVVGGAASPSAAGSTSAVTAGARGASSASRVRTAAGVTRAGFDCRPGVRQLPWSKYAAPCVAKFTGQNPGATHRGVTEKTIKLVIAIRDESSRAATNAIYEQAGLPSNDTTVAVLERFLPWFNSVYELYGRKVVLEKMNLSGSGREEECADATRIAEEMQAFAAVGTLFYNVEGDLAECLARKQVFLPSANGYYAEPWYEKQHPHSWSVFQACDTAARDMAEYIGKRLGKKPAKWAGDETTKQMPRRYGLYLPEEAFYAFCGDTLVERLKKDWGIEVAHRFNYARDAASLSTQAAQAVVQFKAENVTSLILITEFVSITLLTQHAAQQQWHPEWVMAGTALQDVDAAGRLYNQSEVDGHMFGLSQFSGPGIEDPKGEAMRAWKAAAPDEIPPAGMHYLYYVLVDIWNKLQSGGPPLTPQSIATGLRAMPPGGHDRGEFGRWSYADTHSAVRDSREVYWDGTKQSRDGGQGTFVATYGGRRFKSGEWPREEPPIYPDQR